jgi:hypothetical protein
MKGRYWAPFAIFALAVFAGAQFVIAQSGLNLKANDVMTPQELNDTGLLAASPAQRQAFNKRLNQYTLNVVSLVGQRTRESVARSPNACNPAIESTLAGEFNGWEGDTIFKLDNGQIWEQAEYSYTYSYSYRPDVTIYQVSGGCRLKVEDEEETIMVRRIK